MDFNTFLDGIECFTIYRIEVHVYDEDLPCAAYESIDETKAKEMYKDLVKNLRERFKRSSEYDISFKRVSKYEYHICEGDLEDIAAYIKMYKAIVVQQPMK